MMHLIYPPSATVCVATTALCIFFTSNFPLSEIWENSTSLSNPTAVSLAITVPAALHSCSLDKATASLPSVTYRDLSVASVVGQRPTSHM